MNVVSVFKGSVHLHYKNEQKKSNLTLVPCRYLNSYGFIWPAKSGYYIELSVTSVIRDYLFS